MERKQLAIGLQVRLREAKKYITAGSCGVVMSIGHEVVVNFDLSQSEPPICLRDVNPNYADKDMLDQLVLSATLSVQEGILELVTN